MKTISNSFNEPVEEVLVIWEAYSGNYDTVKHNIEESEISDEEEYDDDFADDMKVKGLIPIHIGGQQEIIPDFTPWGKFDSSNPFSPTNLYDIQIAHFKGFSASDIPELKQILNGIHGVAMWSIIDKYRVAIAPAASYNTSEVKEKVQNAIYKYFNVQFGTKDMEEYIKSLMDTSEREYLDTQKDNILIIFPQPNFSVENICEPTEEDYAEIKRLHSMVKGLLVIKNGKFFNPNSIE